MSYIKSLYNITLNKTRTLNLGKFLKNAHDLTLLPNPFARLIAQVKGNKIAFSALVKRRQSTEPGIAPIPAIASRVQFRFPFFRYRIAFFSRPWSTRCLEIGNEAKMRTPMGP